MTPIELDDLMAGLTSPFWAWFQQYVTHEWGPAGLRYQQAVRSAAESPNAVIELQKVLYAQEQLLSLMRHPSEKLNLMRQQVLKASPRVAEVMASRGGV